jgi:hypothetical protein
MLDIVGHHRRAGGEEKYPKVSIRKSSGGAARRRLH